MNRSVDMSSVIKPPEDEIHSRILRWPVLGQGASRRRIFEVLLRSSADGYLVRLTEVLPRREGDAANPREYLALLVPPEVDNCFGEAFYRRRVQLRTEMIGWIKGQLTAGAVALTKELHAAAGFTITGASGEYRMLVSRAGREHPGEVVALPDDLKDLDGSEAWRKPTDADRWWTD